MHLYSRRDLLKLGLLPLIPQNRRTRHIVVRPNPLRLPHAFPGGNPVFARATVTYAFTTLERLLRPVPANITVAAVESWLTVSVPGGTPSNMVTIPAGSQVVYYGNPATLSAGTQTGHIVFSATGMQTITLPVTFPVTSGPPITATPSSLSYLAIAGGANPVTQKVSLAFTAQSAWTAALSGTDAAKFVLDHASGSGNDYILVYPLNPQSTQNSATYTATLTITQGVNTQPITITMTTTAPTVYATDTLTGSAGNLSGRTTTTGSKTWAYDGGDTWTIDGSNHVVAAVGSVRGKAYVDTGANDGLVTVNGVTGAHPGMVGSADGPGSKGWLWYDLSTLNKQNGSGVGTSVGGAGVLAPSTSYLGLCRKADAVAVLVNGMVNARYHDVSGSPITQNGKHGLYSADGTYSAPVAWTSDVSALPTWSGAGNAPLFIVDGDSISANQNVGENGFMQFAMGASATLMQCDFALNGVGGIETEDGGAGTDSIRRYPGTINPLFAGSRARKILVYKGLTNDLRSGFFTASQLYTHAVDYYNTAMASSNPPDAVVMMTVPSCGFDTLSQATNDLIRQNPNWYTWDVAANPLIGGTSASANTTIFPDNLHPSVQGHREMARTGNALGKTGADILLAALNGDPIVIRPSLAASPTSVTFPGASTGSGPTTQTIAVTTTAQWSAVASGSGYSISPSSGVGSGTITVTFTPGALSAGTYTGNVVITGINAPTGGTYPASITVNLSETLTTPPTTLLSETFTRANTTAGNMGTPSSPDFVPAGGYTNVSNFYINGNQLWSTGGAFNHLTVDLGAGNTDVTVTATARTGNGLGVEFRKTDDNNTYRFYIFAGTRCYFTKVVSGTETPITQQSGGDVNGVPSAGDVVSVTISGSTVTAKKNGATMSLYNIASSTVTSSWTDLTYTTQTKAGLEVTDFGAAALAATDWTITKP